MRNDALISIDPFGLFKRRTCCRFTGDSKINSNDEIITYSSEPFEGLVADVTHYRCSCDVKCTRYIKKGFLWLDEKPIFGSTFLGYVNIIGTEQTIANDYGSMLNLHLMRINNYIINLEDILKPYSENFDDPSLVPTLTKVLTDFADIPKGPKAKDLPQTVSTLISNLEKSGYELFKYGLINAISELHLPPTYKEYVEEKEKLLIWHKNTCENYCKNKRNEKVPFSKNIVHFVRFK